MEIAIQKNEHYEIEIMDIGEGGEGIGKINDFTLFIPGVLIGDVIEVRILKVKKSYGYGKLVRIIKPSPFRQEVACELATKCGGCQLQHMQYQAQLDWKQKKVENCLKRIGKLEDIVVEPTLGMTEPFRYRNKAQYPIRKENGKVQMGFFASRSHRLVPLSDCVIQHPENAGIMKIVKDFLEDNSISIYDEQTHKGLVRHLVIRTGYHSNEIMVCLVINGKSLPYSEVLVTALQTIPNVTSIVLNHHTEKSNVILGNQCTVIHGKETITDHIGSLKFNISPLAFFQVNPLQTEVLYEKALEYTELTGEEVVWDAYCGIGTISLFLAQKAKKVYGVEIVPQAIENAKANAELNGISNVEFFIGKAEEIIPKCYEQGIVADTIVVDPPRKGCDEKLLQTLKEMVPSKIVYVSCDPATLARDLAYLTKEAGYQVDKVQPIDMFPSTTHVETIVKLVK